MMIKNKKQGFTLAEVLIALTIIGVIAAITIPVFMRDVRKQEIETRLEQTYSLLNNALTLAVAEHGAAHTWDEMKLTSDTNQTLPFFYKYLAPHLNFLKEGNKYLVESFGYGAIYSPNGEVYISKDENISMAVLANGSSFVGMNAWQIYNKNDTSIKKIYSVQYYIDVNGTKKPNTLGRDVFPFNLILMDQNPHFEMTGNRGVDLNKITNLKDATSFEYITKPESELIEECKDTGKFCGALIQRNGWKVPENYPIRI